MSQSLPLGTMREVTRHGALCPGLRTSQVGPALSDAADWHFAPGYQKASPSLYTFCVSSQSLVSPQWVQDGDRNSGA